MNCSAASIRISRAYFAARLARVVLLLLAGLAPVPAQGRRATPAQLETARDHVRKGWRTFMRSNRDLAAAAVDPKFKPAGSASTHRWPVYVSRDENLAAVTRTLRAQLRGEDFARIELRRLPARGWEAEPGLLYLPRPYVVPGGRFNEMYGWDSYFILVGLLRDGETALARDMVENFLYEVEHNTIVEKYDVERRTSSLGAGLRFGYTSNEIGFGWTSAAFTELYAQLPPAARMRVLELDGVGAP